MFKAAIETPRELLDTPESDWPIGSQATLAAPFEVNRGLWAAPRLVSMFVKKPNGLWMSEPGADVSYPTLSALALAAPVLSVYTPGMGSSQATGLPDLQTTALDLLGIGDQIGNASTDAAAAAVDLPVSKPSNMRTLFVVGGLMALSLWVIKRVIR